MPVMDEFQAERDRILKHGTWKEKLAYFWSYYKWHTIAIIIISYVAISLIVTFVTRKDPGFYTVLINGTGTGLEEQFREELTEYLAIDTTKEEVVMEADMYMNWNHMSDVAAATVSKITVYVSAGDLDVIQADMDSFDYFSYNGILCDLREVLTPEQITKYEPYFYYMDYKKFEERQAADEANDYSYTLVAPTDPYDPSCMEKPIPVAIDLSRCTNFSAIYHFKNEILWGVFKTSTRQEMCSKYLDFIASK